jgi:uncharacterized membrane protein SpoIIM required for sporulation
VRSVEFRRDREASWRELEGLLEKADRGGLRSLPPAEVERIPALYRGALASLAVARAISLDRALLEYLEGLAARAYFRVYAHKGSLGAAVAGFLARGFPRAFRAFGRHVALAAALMTMGGLSGYLLTRSDVTLFEALVSASYASGRGPYSTTAELRAVLYQRGSGLATFAMFLFSHNARIGLSAAALGVLAGLPSLLLMFTNGVTVGAFAALYETRALGTEFWAWVLPHGVTELGAVAVCGGAGLAIGEGLLFPGRQSRLRSAGERGRAVAPLVLGAVLMFFVAGLIEGVFRQTVHATGPRYALAGTTAVLWSLYFALAGRRDEEPS